MLAYVAFGRCVKRGKAFKYGTFQYTSFVRAYDGLQKKYYWFRILLLKVSLRTVHLPHEGGRITGNTDTFL